MKKILLSLLILLALSSFAGNYYLFTENKKLQELVKNPNVIYQNEETQTIAKLSSLIDLPSDEKPTVATVLDKEKLKDQAFFAKAENGDKLIVFAQNKKAILFRESSNKIIEFAQLVLESEPAPTATLSPKTTVDEKTN